MRHIDDDDDVPACCSILSGQDMLSNVEIKAKVSQPLELAKMASQLSQSEGSVIRQHDTFFNCRQGRLKLRDFMVRPPVRVAEKRQAPLFCLFCV